jgi:hypothetical protein
MNNEIENIIGSKNAHTKKELPTKATPVYYALDLLNELSFFICFNPDAFCTIFEY